MKRLPLSILRSLSKLTALCPRQVFALRYYAWSKRIIDWETPHNIQEFSMCQLFRKDTSLDFFAQLADKVGVREYVKQRIGRQYLNQLYGTWPSAEAIDFDSLPDRFVLKTNNGCGSNVIVRNKEKIDRDAVKKELAYWLRYPYGDLTGQIHYSRITPLILAEEYLEQEKGKNILPYDYKLYCFRGEPRFILFQEDRKLNGHITSNMLFDTKWNAIPDAVNHPIAHPVLRPKSLDTMLQIAAQLSKGIDFVRIDFYEIGDKPIFGEITLTPDILTYIRPGFSPLMQLHLQ